MNETEHKSELPESIKLEQIRIVYDYIKFHIGLYLATPPVLWMVADAVGVEGNKLFFWAFMIMIVLFIVSGSHVSFFMTRNVLREWEEGYLEKLGGQFFSKRRLFIQHGLYWIGIIPPLAIIAIVPLGNKLWGAE